MNQFAYNRVPVLELAFELNLAKLNRAAKQYASSALSVTDGVSRGVVLLSAGGMSLSINGRTQVAAVVAVPCLGGRLRPLLKCPRAHEGNFQSLYLTGGELACRYCHALRYRTTLAPTATARARFARHKLMSVMGGEPGIDVPVRRAGAWRKKYTRQILALGQATQAHYEQLRAFLTRSRR